MPNYFDSFIDPFELTASEFNDRLNGIDAQVKVNADAIASSGTEFDAASIHPQGRLTLSSTLPVTTSDVTAATTLYYLRKAGNYIPIYNGSDWVLREVPSSGVSISVPATTNTNYDVFVVWSGSALALELVAWSNNTTRATALGTQDGIYVDSTDSTRRYVGTIRTTGVSGQCEDSKLRRFVWNYYNRVKRSLLKTDTTSSWVYTTGVYRQARGVAANLFEFVVGVAEDTVTAKVVGGVTATAGTAVTGIGVDSGAVNSAFLMSGAGSAFAASVSEYSDSPGIGYHFFAWLEKGGGSGTTTWYGGINGISSGIMGEMLA